MAILASSDTGVTPRNLLLGFVAAAISVVIFHQGMFLILNLLGLLPAKPWSLAPIPPYGVPTLVNQMFWGGLWGVLFAAILPIIPGRANWLKGFIFGVLGPNLIGNWLLVAVIKGRPLFAGFVPLNMLNGILIGGAFGIGLALIYDQLRKRI